jgi:hypothetical protein
MTSESHSSKGYGGCSKANNKMDFVAIKCSYQDLAALFLRVKAGRMLYEIISSKLFAIILNGPCFMACRIFLAKKSALVEKIGRRRYNAQDK